jgi:membrane protease YdiL (CAAX protease family)
LAAKIAAWKIMTLFDDHPPNPPDENLAAPLGPAHTADSASSEPVVLPLAGDPISYAAVTAVVSLSPRPDLPEDLRISWSWVHLICFIIFGFASLLVIQTVFAIHYAPPRPLPEKELEQYLFSKPQFTLGSNVAWFASLFLFLYVTLSVLPAAPFWRTLGWRKLKSGRPGTFANPWLYFFCGSALSFLAALVGSRVHTPDNMPIELLLRSRTGALLLMGMAVFVAPLVEETVFRGYLYPLLARWFGIVPGILLTGLLFGLMHGAQLGWSWGIVILLIFVGITFTYVRARTGTVFASYLMHLGYNSLIAVASIAGTKGFTQMPPGH